MIHNIIPQFISLRFWYHKFGHIFLVPVVKFDVNIPKTSGEIDRNVAWKLENVVTTLNKTIYNISTIFSYYLWTKYNFAVFSLWMKYLDEKLPYLQVLAILSFQNFLVRPSLLKSLETFFSDQSHNYLRPACMIY